MKETEMRAQDHYVKWWQLYLAFPLLIGLFMLDSRLKISVHWHQAVQIGIVLFVYGLIQLWLNANAKKLRAMDQSRYGDWVTVIKIQPHELTDAEAHDRRGQLRRLPDPEPKGMLGDTFEMDYIDAESFPIDEIAEGSKKE
jgi:hypothetical protein